MLFTLDELASYPGAEGISDSTAELLSQLTFDLIEERVPSALVQVSAEARAIALEVTARAFRNPNGYASEAVDDYRYQRPAATAAAGVYLTEDELSRLQAVALGTKRRRVRSVRLQSWSVPQL